MRPRLFWSVLVLAGPVLNGASFIVFCRLIPRTGATNASTVTFVARVSAVLPGRSMPGEPVGLSELAGMALIFAGLLVIDGRVLRWHQQAWR